MRKIIWSCWWQGRAAAPPVVRACLTSWQRMNPGWELRCLDAGTALRYSPLGDYVDLQRQRVTAPSLSDILRISLLHEFGGVWADATTICNRPLDEWLPAAAGEGFFAFDRQDPVRPVSSWFLAAETGNPLVSEWLRRVVGYWRDREAADDYFWFHHLFGEICESDAGLADMWGRVPRLSARLPHLLQYKDRMYRPAREVHEEVDWSTPVFKVTYRLKQPLVPGCLLEQVLGPEVCEAPAENLWPGEPAAPPVPMASLKVSTENLGDHIQIIAGKRLLQPLGVRIDRLVDRDDEIASVPGLAPAGDPLPILLNGWFKSNRAEWPPHPRLAPVIFGFHVRLRQCPELASPESIAFFKRHEPVGCRDTHTLGLMREWGVEAFLSRCLSLTLPRRLPDPAQREVFVVSRDERIGDFLPETLGPCTFISHYSGSADFATNMDEAEKVLALYRDKARLIVTTLLHCALPAIAMGIPVIVFYPLNTEKGHASDIERFSGLADLVPVHDLEKEASGGWSGVDWTPAPVDVSGIKLETLDRFYACGERWNLPPSPPVGPIAPETLLAAHRKPAAGASASVGPAEGSGGRPFSTLARNLISSAHRLLPRIAPKP
ncbi:MAG: capsular polysaccharide synthesis protein [Parvibaculum sp.]